MNKVCPWPNPGSNPYIGTIYDDVIKRESIPLKHRLNLIGKMESKYKKYIAHVSITNRGIEGSRFINLRNMNEGTGKVCEGLVDVKMWPDNHKERALVFQSGPYTLLWFSVCRNIAEVDDVEWVPPDTMHRPECKPYEVPEPSSLALVALPLLFLLRRRMKRVQSR